MSDQQLRDLQAIIGRQEEELDGLREQVAKLEESAQKDGEKVTHWIDECYRVLDLLDAEREQHEDTVLRLENAIAHMVGYEKMLRARVAKLERVATVYRTELLRLDDMFIRAAFYINGQPIHENYAMRPSRPGWFPENSSGQRISLALAVLEAPDE